jgi:phenylpropionate dioxygenase-like ring-hydroxylating dioxygenase large terminal subunit
MPLNTQHAGSNWPDSWRLLENGHGARKGRYTDPAFQRLEYNKLWKTVWQFAARLDEISATGDYTTYEIGDQSVIVVRVNAQTIKAYHNFCPHRGTALSAGGCGHFSHGIICPFHGWKWDLAGNNTFIMEQHEFRDGTLKNSDVALKKVHVEVYAGFVFINFDDKPAPFDEFIAPVRQYLDDLIVGEMHHYWWKSAVLPANWKVAQEAFFETYHVPATHPQLDEPGRQRVYEDVPNALFMHSFVGVDAFPNGHGRFYNGEKPEGAEGDLSQEELYRIAVGFMEQLHDGMDAMVLKEDVELAKSLLGKPIPEGSSGFEELIKVMYTRAAEQKRPMPVPTPETCAMWGGEIFVFPNLLILPNLGNTMLYRSRPNGDDPDSCVFEIFSTRTYPADTPIPRAEVELMTALDNPEQFRLIPRQDLANIPRIQKGLHSDACKQVWFSNYHEQTIANMHRELDRYLAAPGLQS